MSTISFASEDQFEAASSWLISTPAAAGLPNEIKLEVHPLPLYGPLFQGRLIDS